MTLRVCHISLRVCHISLRVCKSHHFIIKFIQPLVLLLPPPVLRVHALICPESQMSERLHGLFHSFDAGLYIAAHFLLPF
jgi:hypothetical protein